MTGATTIETLKDESSTIEDIKQAIDKSIKSGEFEKLCSNSERFNGELTQAWKAVVDKFKAVLLNYDLDDDVRKQYLNVLRDIIQKVTDYRKPSDKEYLKLVKQYNYNAVRILQLFAENALDADSMSTIRLRRNVNELTAPLHEIANLSDLETFFRQSKDEVHKILTEKYEIPDSENLLAFGPLQKSSPTQALENVVKNLLAGKTYNFNIINNNYIISLDGNDINLSELLDTADLDDIVLSTDDLDAYVRFIQSNEYPVDLLPRQKHDGGAEINPHYKKYDGTANPPQNPRDFIPSELYFQSEDVEHEHDALHYGHKLAINLYTFRDGPMNDLLRNAHSDPLKLKSSNSNDTMPAELKALLLANVVCVNGLTADPDTQHYGLHPRGENIHQVPEMVTNQRLESLQTGKVINTKGFTSTAQHKVPLGGFTQGQNVLVEGRGRNIKALSYMPWEGEILYPPGQIQIRSKMEAKKLDDQTKKHTVLFAKQVRAASDKPINPNKPDNLKESVGKTPKSKK